jgi:hypothetical protein
MEMELNFIFRMPKFPLIFIRGDALFSADSPRSLVNLVAEEIQGVEDERIVFIDSTGEEFLYHDGSKSLMPTILRTSWPKRKIIELYNSSVNARKSGTSYSEKSLSAKTYRKIFNDVAELIRINRP